jgi:hypothetical protein
MLLLLTLEAVAFLALAAAVSGPRSSPTARRALGVSVALLAVTAGAAWAAERRERRTDEELLAAETPALTREDYVTSDTCRSCHPREYHTWHRSFHRTMTQIARPGAVVPAWEGELESRGRRYELFTRGDVFWADVVDPDWERAYRLAGRDPDADPAPPRARLPVVMTTGSHHMQTYWVPSEAGREVYNLPFVYLFEDERWVPREDVFLRPPNAGRLIGLWNNSCIECHSTAGAIGFDFASEEFTDTRVAEMGISCEACHGPAEEHVAQHRNPLARFRQRRAPETEGDPTIVHPERLDHERATYVCGQCHGVWMADDDERWLREGHPFRPGDDLTDTRFVVRPAGDRGHPRLRELLSLYPRALDSRFWPDGMVRVSGREMSGMIESPCYQPGEMSCLSCHSMHDSDPNDQLAAVALAGHGGDPRQGIAGNGACVQCHEGFRDDAALTAHTRHPLESAGSSCMNCHMPYTTYGLLKGIRSHQISNPSAQETLAVGRPNACNACHLDRPLSWAADELAAGWGVPRPPPGSLSRDQDQVAASLLWLLSGDAGQRALTAWYMGWEPARQASGEAWLAPYLGHLLADPYAAVRYVAGHSLVTLPGWESLDYDYVAPPRELGEARSAAIQGYLDRVAGGSVTPERRGPGVLLGPRGELLLGEVARLALARDDTPISLEE